jgi:hypothetical protein
LHPAIKSLPLDQPIDQEALKSALKQQLAQNSNLKAKQQALILTKSKLADPTQRES